MAAGAAAAATIMAGTAGSAVAAIAADRRKKRIGQFFKKKLYGYFLIFIEFIEKLVLNEKNYRPI